MTVELNKVAIQVAELNNRLYDLVNKADEIFKQIEDEDEKVAYYKPFEDGINKAEVALEEAAHRLLTQVIANI